jgi:hypothetical protein
MTVALTLAAIRRHPFSTALTALLTIITARLVGAPAPLALSIWTATVVVGLELAYALEPTVLKRLARYRDPTNAERQRLDSALGRRRLYLLVADTPDLAAARGLRCLVVSRDLMEVLEDRALSGILNQAAASVQAANLAGFGLIWLGNLPVLVAWVASRMIGGLGRLLAIIVGTALVLPLVLFPNAFLRWTGRLFSLMLVSLIGSVLISVGYAAIGLGLLVAWLIVAALRSLLAWESRRVEAAADSATIAAGLGSQLLEAVDFLALAEPLPPRDLFLKVLRLSRSSSVQRGERLRRGLAASHAIN